MKCLTNFHILALCENEIKGKGEEFFWDKLGYKWTVGREFGKTRITLHCEEVNGLRRLEKGNKLYVTADYLEIR